MAPTDENIESALRTAIQETIDAGDEELLTVRYVRNQVYKALKLDEGFLESGDWKARSKEFIHVTADRLLNSKETQLNTSVGKTPKAAKKEVAPVKKAPKRAAQIEKSRPAKRRKKEETPAEEQEDEELEEELDSDGSEDDDDESHASESDDSNVREAPKSKRKSNSKSKPKTKTAAKRQTKNKAKAESDEKEDSESVSDVGDSNAPSKPPRRATKNQGPIKQRSKRAVLNSDDESEDGKPTKEKTSASRVRKSEEKIVDSEEDSEGAKHAKNKPQKNMSKSTVFESDEESQKEKSKKQSPVQKKSQSLPNRESKPVISTEKAEVLKDSKSDKTVDTKAIDSDSSETSILLDEPPKSKKRIRKPKSSSSTAAKESPKGPTPNSTLIKTLQSQLVKCGVRKIWAFELKPYADDEKAKIKHLQGMLRDIGMTGRFSEQRAKEIKELRELQADLEAVREGEKSWGLESGRRARGVRKSLRESSVEGEDDEDEGAGGGVGTKKERSSSAREMPSKAASNAARLKQELAFLGDEESDSD